MSALRVACRTPWGDVHDLLVLQQHVIVPQSLGHVPPLWWLGDEHHPRVAVTLVGALERETGASLGLSPYCVPTTRWNASARAESWLPIVPAEASTASLDSSAEMSGSGHSQLDRFPLPRDVERCDVDSRCGNRLHGGRYALSALVGWPRGVVTAGLLAATVLALAYYLIAIGVWLWTLRQGMTGRNVQDGVVLLVAAVATAAIARALARVAAGPDGHRRAQPILATVLDGFRMGIWLQLVAFLGFLIF